MAADGELKTFSAKRVQLSDGPIDHILSAKGDYSESLQFVRKRFVLINTVLLREI